MRFFYAGYILAGARELGCVPASALSKNSRFVSVHFVNFQTSPVNSFCGEANALKPNQKQPQNPQFDKNKEITDQVVIALPLDFLSMFKVHVEIYLKHKLTS